MAAPTEKLREILLMGEVCLPGEPGYEQAIVLPAFSAVRPPQEERPRAVVKPRNTREVQEVVKFAVENSYELTVKGGAHSIRNECLVKDSIMVDLCLMRGVSVDAKAKTCVAEGGCLLYDIDASTSIHGLATPLGTAPVTGMGLALGGGHGNMTRYYGCTAAHILWVELVDAKGDVVCASEDENPDLFWAVRGAASAFGVVTHIKFKLHDVTSFVGGTIVLADTPDRSVMRKAMHWLRYEALKDEHIGLGASVWGATDPDGKPFVMAYVGYHGTEKTPEEKQAAVAGLRAAGPIIQDNYGKMTYFDLQMVLMPMLKNTPTTQAYWSLVPLRTEEATEALMDAYQAYVASMPEAMRPFTLLVFDAYGGKMKEGDLPVGFKEWDCTAGMVAAWLDPAHNEEHVAWVKGFRPAMAAVTTYSPSLYGNLSMHDAPSASHKAAVYGGEANLARLMQLKAKYDPEGVFKHCPLMLRK